MKKIKSYTSIWSVEKVIYAINDFQLPFPLTFSQMAWFVVSLFVVILFGELPPFNMIDGAFINANIRMYRNDHLKMYKITL